MELHTTVLWSWCVCFSLWKAGILRTTPVFCVCAWISSASTAQLYPAAMLKVKTQCVYVLSHCHSRPLHYYQPHFSKWFLNVCCHGNCCCATAPECGQCEVLQEKMGSKCCPEYECGELRIHTESTNNVHCTHQNMYMLLHTHTHTFNFPYTVT